VNRYNFFDARPEKSRRLVNRRALSIALESLINLGNGQRIGGAFRWRRGSGLPARRPGGGKGCAVMVAW
jgi:hypothetical protein